MRSNPQKSKPRIVIIGAGFAGISATKELAKENVEIILIDRRNHHLFQPLLYQVATASLSPSQIAQPTRLILKKQKNCTTALAEVTGINANKKIIHGSKGDLQYDHLILATGATHTYFGHKEWAPFAPGIKTIEDALSIRSKILDAFEQAELSSDPAQQESLLTFVIVGGGPTGVEMAGAIAELARHTLPEEFRRIKPNSAKIILIEAGPKILTAFPEHLSQRAEDNLKELGVTVKTEQAVTSCSSEGVHVGDKFVPAHTIIWSAGVKASPAAQWLNVKHDKAGRVIVNSNLTVPEYPDIYVVGDTASVVDKNGLSVPGLAPAAEQQGRYAAQSIIRTIKGQSVLPLFAYKDHGIMATIGRGKAIAKIKNFSFSGFFAWYLWGLIHLMPLVGFRNRFVVATDWFWSYLSKARSVRLITTSKNKNSE